jgi:hypothetical protein
VAKLTAPDGAPNAQFGKDTDIDGDVIIAGAYLDPERGIGTGAAYLFHKDLGGLDSWGMVKKITADNAQPNDYFGYAVAVSGDDAIAGAYKDDDEGIEAGAVYVYREIMNQPPVCAGGVLPDATEGQAYSATIEASDPDSAATLTFELVESPGWLAVSGTTDSTVTLAGTPAESDTTALVEITIHVLDGVDTAKASFTFAVLDTAYAPVADEDASALSNGYVKHVWSDTLHATDADGSDRGNLMWEIVDNGGLAGLAITDSILTHPAFAAEDRLATHTVVVRVVDLAGTADTLTLDLQVTWPVGVGASLPTETALLANVPNPFNPTTIVGFSLASDGPVSLCVYNALGQQVRTLASGYTTAGHHTVTWNGRDDRGNAAASGVYMYRLVTGDKVMVKRMTLVR